jgi:mercuric reductase
MREPAESVRLVIVGGGSAAFAAAGRAAELGASVTLVNKGLPWGGTCVNVGCVPSKTLIRAAEALRRPFHVNFNGIRTFAELTDFKAVVDQKRELVERLRQAKYVDLAADLPRAELVSGRGRMVDSRTVEVDGRRISGDRVLIATGASPYVPPIPGLADSGYLTNESLFELESPPRTMMVLGGRYVALECAQMMARFGTKVTVLRRSERILPAEAPDLTEALTGYLRNEGIEVLTGVEVRRVARDAGGVEVEARAEGSLRRFEATHLLVATGRAPNTRDLGLDDVGVRLNDKGFIAVDDALRTTAEGVYAAGDVIGEPQYVYTAAYEGVLAADNAVAGGGRKRDYRVLPWVIFTDPQVAGVGLDEREAVEQGIDVDVATLPLTQVPRCLAARDSRGFIKLVRDRAVDRLVGARILAPEGSELLMEIVMAIRFQIPLTNLRELFHPYLTLGEGVKLAAISFEKDVAKLSCCVG